jgi:hypothetical protein
VSQQNTQTGRLTEGMFDRVLERARQDEPAIRPGEGTAENHRVQFGRALNRRFAAPSPMGEG